MNSKSNQGSLIFAWQYRFIHRYLAPLMLQYRFIKIELSLLILVLVDARYKA